MTYYCANSDQKAIRKLVEKEIKSSIDKLHASNVAETILIW
jgi:hypothetical protein